ncbi:MAG TPA: hypothetical protein VGG29_13430 [Caulobacteraceae bacterium]|jgi:hypothetical protein
MFGRDPATATGLRRGPHRPDPPAASAFADQEAFRFFYRWGGELSSILIRIRARFDGDLDQYLLYLIFLLAELSQTVLRADAAARGERPPLWVRRGMNALSLADITRIPRETARRKLQLLVAHRYLERGEGGLYYLADRYGLDEFFAELKPLFWDGLMPARGH